MNGCGNFILQKGLPFFYLHKIFYTLKCLYAVTSDFIRIKEKIYKNKIKKYIFKLTYCEIINYN
ncbi:hypothetical protein E6A31_11800 [Enterococcus faecium]|uniref:Uncharacterized protein n=1 Tax=Siphoviridae sp. ctRRO23 TaxID=2826334 RepID=A0A8S5LTC5_9CAUD|nr:hypothetical protein E6A31_11800 [Enterococcus faecium]DAD73123.1 MAG TPA: hypothetical protein [Siphoviridae sp. ctRRO23]